MRNEIQFLAMPLAGYREIVAILRQVEGVKTGLLEQKSQKFDYYQSQIGGLWIEYADNISPLHQQRLEEILTYYSDRFGPRQTIN
jgi:hypothetical protein